MQRRCFCLNSLIVNVIKCKMKLESEWADVTNLSEDENAMTNGSHSALHASKQGTSCFAESNGQLWRCLWEERSLFRHKFWKAFNEEGVIIMWNMETALKCMVLLWFERMWKAFIELVPWETQKKNQMVMKMAVLMNNDRVQEKSETCQATETTETSKMQQNGFI